MTLAIMSFILLFIVNIFLGIAIGRLIGHWEMKPIINSYKRIAEDYKKLVYKERAIREDMDKEYKKLIDIFKRHI